MSKAEEKSKFRYVTFAEECAFIDGYEQAEKDNELTWEDIEKVCLIAREVHQFRGFWSESVYQEVLKRFNKGMRNK